MYPASLLVVLLWVRELASTREQRGLFSVVLDRHGAVMTELPFVMRIACCMMGIQFVTRGMDVSYLSSLFGLVLRLGCQPE